MADHSPLLDAAAAGEVIPLFVLDPYFFAPRRAAELPNRLRFLLGSLAELEGRLKALGSRLVLAEGRSVEVVPALAQRWKVDQVFAHRWVEPFGRERDAQVARALKVPFVLYEGETLVPPGALRSGSGQPYAVFTAFARAHALAMEPSKPRPAPRALPPLPKGLELPRVELPSPRLDSAASLPEPGEAAAQRRLRRFLRERAGGYDTGRDRMDHDATSRLSADLKFGTLSARTVWSAVEREVPPGPSQTRFLNELRWREFSHAVLWSRPEVLEQPFQPAFRGFPWRRDERLWRAWCEGRTGYPVVDAAARQLLAEGFVHNRARMVAASFLAKHLLLDFRLGEAHYLKHLVDGDWAQNDLGWQWSAGCGCDAQPYFRVFNPVAQGERFDPTGEYVRRWVPELRGVEDRWLQRPWEAPVPPGEYPKPVVEHATARARFLEVAKAHLAAQRRRLSSPARARSTQAALPLEQPQPPATGSRG